MPKKQAITLEQRQSLRNWAHSQHPKPSQKACIEWFYNKYNHKLSQSTVSESLSSHFTSLNDLSTVGQRLQLDQWPEPEKVLFD